MLILLLNKVLKSNLQGLNSICEFGLKIKNPHCLATLTPSNTLFFHSNYELNYENLCAVHEILHYRIQNKNQLTIQDS